MKQNNEYKPEPCINNKAVADAVVEDIQALDKKLDGWMIPSFIALIVLCVLFILTSIFHDVAILQYILYGCILINFAFICIERSLSVKIRRHKNLLLKMDYILKDGTLYKVVALSDYDGDR